MNKLNNESDAVLLNTLLLNIFNANPEDQSDNLSSKGFHRQSEAILLNSLLLNSFHATTKDLLEAPSS